MIIHCTRCKSKTEHQDTETKTTKNNRSIVTGRCSVCNKKNSSFLSKTSGGMLPALIPLATMNTTAMIFNDDERRIIKTAKGILKKNGFGLYLATGDGLILNGSGIYLSDHLFMCKSKLRQGGVIGIDDIIAIIIAIVTLVTTIVELIKQREAQEAEEKEKKRREDEAKRAADDQKLYELKKMLQSYNETLGELAQQAQMDLKDYIIEQLKDNESKVSKMKNTILAKAKEFLMTPPAFIDYCNEIAAQYEWWNIGILLDVMKTL
jgi:heme exporter protein D